MMRYLLSFLLLFSLKITSSAIDIAALEDSVLYYHNQSVQTYDTNLIEKYHRLSVAFLRKALKKQNAFDYPFNKLAHINKVRVDDGKLRSFFWSIPLTNERTIYSGFFLLKVKRKKRLYYLENKAVSQEFKLAQSNEINNWYGAVYFDIRTFRTSGKKKYLLLGWRKESPILQAKFADIVEFEKRNLSFGFDLFNTKKGIQKRIYLPYSTSVRCNLKYNEEEKLIFFDRLIPSQSQFVNSPETYSTSFIFDGYEFNKGQWIFKEDVDVRPGKK